MAATAWLPISRGDVLPENALAVGTYGVDGMVYVGRLNGEVGKINLKDGKMWNFRAHHQSHSYDAEILTCSAVYKWVALNKGDPIPAHAVAGGRTPTDGLVFVGHSSLEPGKINVSDGKMNHFWSHNQGKCYSALILVVEPPVAEAAPLEPDRPARVGPAAPSLPSSFPSLAHLSQEELAQLKANEVLQRDLLQDLPGVKDYVGQLRALSQENAKGAEELLLRQEGVQGLIQQTGTALFVRGSTSAVVGPTCDVGTGGGSQPGTRSRMSCDAASEKRPWDRELAVEKEKRQAAEAKVKDTQKRWTAAATWLADAKKRLQSVETELKATASEHRKALDLAFFFQSALERLERLESQQQTQDRMSRDNAWLEAELAREQTRARTCESNHEETRIQALHSALDEEREQRLVAERKFFDSQARSHSAGHDACWQYETDGQWHPFSPEGNEQMHEAYLAYIDDAQEGRWAHIVAGGVERIVDFEEMTQRHATTGRRRSIRIATGVPLQWESTPAELLTQTGDLSAFYVEVEDAAFLKVIKRLLRFTGHAWDASRECSRMKKATVKSVHRIENYHLWRRYQARLRTMREDRAKRRLNFKLEPVALDLDGREGVMTDSQRDLDCGEPLACDVDEKILLHGTSWSNADSIVRHGFDHRYEQDLASTHSLRSRVLDLAAERDRVKAQQSPDVLASRLQTEAAADDHEAEAILTDVLEQAQSLEASSLSDFSRKFLQSKKQKHAKLALKEMILTSATN
ncbi:unnamed protein product [Symbiodinium necroappetens]|uniref:WWE domain-containing protein n=1 Tax=Symbiodinium necroappetens TaxID=1628268 RepID=A0A812PF57_9DINO|nr:unnamed protein product [Symbiodinium necroappetens]